LDCSVHSAPCPCTAALLLLQVRGVHDRVQEILNTEYEASRSYRPTTKDWLASHWQGFMSPAKMSRIRNTGVLCCHVVIFKFKFNILNKKASSSKENWRNAAIWLVCCVC
jgi:hypothetical protein